MMRARIFAAWILLLGAGTTASARTPLEYLRRDLPLGADACQSMLAHLELQARHGGKSNMDLMAVDYSPGWTVGPKGTATRLRKEFADMLGQGAREGGSQEELVIRFLQKHAYLNPEKLRSGKRHPPQAHTRKDQLAVQSHVHNLDVEGALHEAVRSENKTDEDTKDYAIVTALENLSEGGRTLTTDDLSAIGRLYGRIVDLQSRAKKLDDRLGTEGQADSVAWRYVKAHADTFRAKIHDMEEGQNLYIIYPHFDAATKKLSIDVRRISDLVDFETFYQELEVRGKRVEAYEKALDRYTRDYIMYGHLATRFKAIPDREVRFAVNHPGGTKAEEIVKIETENQNKFATYKEGIIAGMLPHLPIHPSPALLAQTKWFERVGKWRRVADNKFTKFSKFFMKYLFIPTNIVVYWQIRVRDQIVASTLELSHALDEGWWIERCSREETKKKVYECMERWGAVVGKALAPRVAEKQKLNPNYLGFDELMLQKQMSERIIFGLFQKGGYHLVGGMQFEYDLRWLPEKIYANLQKEFDKMANEAQKEGKPLPAPTKPASDVLAGTHPGQDVASTAGGGRAAPGSRPLVKEDAIAQLDAYRAKFLGLSNDMDRYLSLTKDEPEQQNTRYRQHAREIIKIQLQIENFANAELGKEFKSRLETLQDSLADELNEVDAKQEELLIQMNKLKPAVKASSGKAPATSATDPKPSAPHPASQLPLEPAAKGISRAPSSVPGAQLGGGAGFGPGAMYLRPFE